MFRRNAKLAVLLAIVMVMGLVPAGVALAEEPCERFGQGYWKQWLAENAAEDYLGEPHTSEKLLDMLDTPARGDADQILTYQFIAAALNGAVNECEMPDAVQEAYDDAKAHLHREEVSDDRSEILGWKDILEFWNQNEQAVLESVWYEGTGCTFGSHADDTLTLTFSNDISFDSTVRNMYFKDESLALPDVAIVTWVAEGNVLKLTAEGTFITPRPGIGDYVVDLEGVVDLIGNRVVVGEVLVEGEECDKAVLLSVVYEGTCSIFGSDEGDVLTLTFSEDIRFDGSTRNMYFKDESLALPDVAIVTWVAEGNVLKLTAEGTFITPRPEVGDFVTALDGIVNDCGCPVVVPDAGVEIGAVTYHYHWGPGVPYGATEEVSAVAIVNPCGMDVWWYSDGTLIAEGWYYDRYNIEAVTGWVSGNPNGWNEPVKYLFSIHFSDVTTVWYLRTSIDVEDVPEPAEGSMLLG